MAHDPIFNTGAIVQWSMDVGIYGVMTSRWGWPIAESIHFLGMSLIIGTVGLFDLRMMGVARGVSMASLHRLVPFGIAGYAMNVVTGFLFVVCYPDQYLYNPAFQTKLTLMGVALVNLMVFYATTNAAVASGAPDDLPPMRARVIGAISLACWLGVIVCGRLITYFRPPEHWCLWCQ